MTNFILYLILVLGLLTTSRAILASDNRDYANYEYKLRQILYGNRKAIDLEHRPSLYSNQSTHVELGISVLGIIDLNALTNTLHLNTWVRVVWYDYTFHWNEEEFGGINVLRIPEKFVWKPDILLQNSVEAADSEIGHYKSNVLAYPNGQILWVPSSTHSVSCAVDLHKFPFDSHVCTFLFRSWSIDGKNLKMEEYNSQKSVDLSDYWNDNEWDVKDAAEKVVYNETEKYTTITFAISLKRRAYYYVLTLITPVLLSWVLMLVLFWLPLWSNQRIFLSSLTVVYLTILSLQLRWAIPNNGSSVPIIVVICGRSIIFAAVLLVFSVALITMVKTADPPCLPIKLKNLLRKWLSCVLCVHRNRIHEIISGAQLLNNSSVELNVDKIDRNEICCDWTLLLTVLNRLVFIIYLFLFVTIFLITILIN